MDVDSYGRRANSTGSVSPLGGGGEGVADKESGDEMTDTWSRGGCRKWEVRCVRTREDEACITLV